MGEIKGFAGSYDKEDIKKEEELDKDIQEATVYVVNGQVYEDLETAKKADAINDLAEVIGNIYYNGINASGLMNEIIENKDELIEVLQRL